MRLPQEMSLAQIAQMIGGKVHGDGNIKVTTVSASPCMPALRIWHLYLIPSW
jgi:hypothetical protein